MRTAKREILALTGRRDLLTDGVWDYCTRLGDALRPCGVNAELAEVEWAKSGWIAALRKLRAQLSQKPYEWAVLQYTAMAWSRRGFPFGALAAAWTAKKHGVQLAVVFHEPDGFRANGVWARLRFTCQRRIIRKLHALANVGIFTVPPSTLRWLTVNDAKACFVPIGSNIPEDLNPRRRSNTGGSPKSIAVFCVTNLDRTEIEVAEIAAAVRYARKCAPNLRLIVFGRGAMEARPLLEQALANCDVELSVRGVLPVEEVGRTLSESDALLYVRDTLSLQHGSSLAAVARGLPVVAYGEEPACFPLNEAGVLLARPGDQQALCIALERVLTDDALWNSLRKRSLETYKKYFTWENIARMFDAALQSQTRVQPAEKNESSLAKRRLDGPSREVAARQTNHALRSSEASDAQ